MKKRVDVILVEKNYYSSREKAQSNLMAGNVYVNNEQITKSGTLIDEEAEITIKTNESSYVSRGGLKLEKAIKSFHLDLSDKICMDVGASTGGFTDCMLKNGASKVYSVDVGYGQLAWELRTNPKVIVMERTNIRYLDPNQISQKIDFVSVDVSFISLKLVLPIIKNLLASDGEAVVLLKPQFEAGKAEATKYKGVIKDKELHKKIADNLVEFIIGMGFHVCGFTFSPIKGPKGNIEFLIYMTLQECNQKYNVEDIIDQAHNFLIEA